MCEVHWISSFKCLSDAEKLFRTCVNCGESHPTNYKGYSVYLQAPKKKSTPTDTPATSPVPKNDLQNFPQLQPTSTIPIFSNNTQHPYSQILQNNKPVNSKSLPQTSNNSISDIISTIISQCLEYIIPQI